ncbi:caveolae-associated protein 2 [Pseudophryne corroboree]|uniref:caveolae-associated protein 2 n=1 Tax=Pseudophryne corroboree TaxID=495146 RepID=UPI003081EAED
MEEDAIQIEKSNEDFQKGGHHESQELVVPSHSPTESPCSSPTPQQLVAADSIKDSNQVNAITVLTLLDKLVNMLDSVQENQNKMEKRQIDIENSVKGIQNDITKLSKSHSSTSNTVSKLLEKSRKVSANMRDVKDRMDKQTVQVKKMESNHNQLLRRNNFKVLIFQEENEIPANVFVKEPTPVPSITEGHEDSIDPNKSQEETMHTIDLSSDDEINHEEDGHDDSVDEKLGPTRAEKMKRSSLKKVDSLKKAFSRQNIEKKMNKISTKIVSPERREKIKKSFTPSQNKSSKGSSFKSPITFSIKKSHDGETAEESEEKSAKEPAEEQAVSDQNDSLKDEKASEVLPPNEEVKTVEVSIDSDTNMEEAEVLRKNIELSIVEDDEDKELDFENENPFSPDYKPKPEELEEAYEAPTQSTGLQIDQSV